MKRKKKMEHKAPPLPKGAGYCKVCHSSSFVLLKKGGCQFCKGRLHDLNLKPNFRAR